MDIRTSQVLEALDPIAGDFLLNLLSGPLTETELIEAAGVAQATGHRRIRKLAEAGIIRQPNGGRGQPWTIVAPQQTTIALEALYSLVDTLEGLDRDKRRDERKILRQSQRERLSVIEAPKRR